jgi:23S rRNA (adenine2030-N6)-methyltransferase
MNYRHHYHAGNFADVLKHTVLIALIQELLKKPTPFCYLDTHAGAGTYDLYADIAEKNKEYSTGISKIIDQEQMPKLIRQYLHCIRHINNDLAHSRFSSLRYYPGSPLIARYFLRPYDRLIACDLQPQEYQLLKQALANDKRCAVHHLDGYLSLKAMLPPREKRALILIDPPYENHDEFQRLLQALPIALQRFATGIYAIWYPLKERVVVERFLSTIKGKINKLCLNIELSIYNDLPNHLNGCGMLIINPPWKFNQVVQTFLPYLWDVLNVGKQGAFKVHLLK